MAHNTEADANEEAVAVGQWPMATVDSAVTAETGDWCYLSAIVVSGLACLWDPACAGE